MSSPLPELAPEKAITIYVEDDVTQPDGVRAPTIRYENVPPEWEDKARDAIASEARGLMELGWQPLFMMNGEVVDHHALINAQQPGDA